MLWFYVFYLFVLIWSHSWWFNCKMTIWSYLPILCLLFVCASWKKAQANRQTWGSGFLGACFLDADFFSSGLYCLFPHLRMLWFKPILVLMVGFLNSGFALVFSRRVILWLIIELAFLSIFLLFFNVQVVKHIRFKSTLAASFHSSSPPWSPYKMQQAAPASHQMKLDKTCTLINHRERKRWPVQ